MLFGNVAWCGPACLSLLVGRISFLHFCKLPNVFDSKPESNFKGNKI